MNSTELEDLTKQIQVGVALLETLLPVVEEIVDKTAPMAEEVIEKVIPFFRDQYMKLTVFGREQNVEAFNYYIKNGFTREEALLLVIDSSVSLRKVVENMGKNKK